MSIRELCRSRPETFLDTTQTLDDSEFVIFGAPMDLTGSYRRGSRFAPGAIRRASRYMESYSLRLNADGEDLPMCDVGDLQTANEAYEWLNQINTVVTEITQSGKTPIMIGGEHTVALGAIRAFAKIAVVDFDAHLDLRNELSGLRLSHATFLRRSLEEKNRTIVVLGARALSKEELAYAQELTYITAKEISEDETEESINAALRLLPEEMPIYITVDMDVLDPSEAPAVCNPAPEGLRFSRTLDILQSICLKRRVVGVDLCEVTPFYDSGLTSIQAAQLLLETVLAIHKSGFRS